MAAAGSTRYQELVVALSFLVGLLCIAAGFARLGVIASFLSRPILTGYLNGIALSIIAGQLGTMLGFHVDPGGFFRTVGQEAARLGETHLPTLGFGLALFLLLRLLKRFAARAPGPLVAAALAIGAVTLLGLDRQGIVVVGKVPASFPTPYPPSVSLSELGPLAAGARSHPRAFSPEARCSGRPASGRGSEVVRELLERADGGDRVEERGA